MTRWWSPAAGSMKAGNDCTWLTSMPQAVALDRPLDLQLTMALALTWSTGSAVNKRREATVEAAPSHAVSCSASASEGLKTPRHLGPSLNAAAATSKLQCHRASI